MGSKAVTLVLVAALGMIAYRYLSAKYPQVGDFTKK